jgi:hypothetical protein
MRGFTYRSKCSGEVKVLVNQPLDEEIRRLLERYRVRVDYTIINKWIG